MNQYPRQSLGHVLYYLRQWGIPERIAGDVTVSRDELTYGGKRFAIFRYFDGIEQPLFRFTDEVYNQQRLQLNEDGTLTPLFRLNLSSHLTPCFEIHGHEATQELYQFLVSRLMSSDIRDPGYRVKTDSGAFFQGGYGNPTGKWFYIEFQIARNAQKAVDFINENYRPSKKTKVD